MDILTARHERSLMTVTLDGRLDALEAAPLRAILTDAIIDGQIDIIIDLSNVEFVDSAGLAALVKAMKDARRAGGDVRLVSPKAADAVRVFELTKFDKVFTMGLDVETLLNRR